MMKYNLPFAVILLFLISVPLSICAEQTKSLPEGMKPYIPTRLEWLAMELNANYRTEMHDLEGYMLSFIPLEAENTILIYVGHSRQTHRGAMNIGIDNARKLIEKTAKSRGWNSWLKVKEKIELIEPRK
jgi:hypothetical protein